MPSTSSAACSNDGAEREWLAVAAVRLVLVAETRGVGQRPCLTIVSNDGRTAAPSESDWL